MNMSLDDITEINHVFAYYRIKLQESIKIGFQNDFNQ